MRAGKRCLIGQKPGSVVGLYLSYPKRLLPTPHWHYIAGYFSIVFQEFTAFESSVFLPAFALKPDAGPHPAGLVACHFGRRATQCAGSWWHCKPTGTKKPPAGSRWLFGSVQNERLARLLQAAKVEAENQHNAHNHQNQVSFHGPGLHVAQQRAATIHGPPKQARYGVDNAILHKLVEARR